MSNNNIVTAIKVTGVVSVCSIASSTSRNLAVELLKLYLILHRRTLDCNVFFSAPTNKRLHFLWIRGFFLVEYFRAVGLSALIQMVFLSRCLLHIKENKCHNGRTDYDINKWWKVFTLRVWLWLVYADHRKSVFHLIMQSSFSTVRYEFVLFKYAQTCILVDLTAQNLIPEETNNLNKDEQRREKEKEKSTLKTFHSADK